MVEEKEEDGGIGGQAWVAGGRAKRQRWEPGAHRFNSRGEPECTF